MRHPIAHIGPLILFALTVSWTRSLDSPAPLQRFSPFFPSTSTGVVAHTGATLPLSFEPNVGQTEAPTEFLAHGPGYSVALTPSGAVLRVITGSSAPRFVAPLRLHWLGTRRVPGLGQARLPGQSHYVLGNTPAEWHTHVANYAEVAYRHLYPHTDLLYYGHRGYLEFDFVLAPGADPRRIRLAVSGGAAQGLDPAGNVAFTRGVKTWTLNRPVAYQERDGKRQAVQATFDLKDAHHLGIKVGPYDRSRTLIIDPVIDYSSYLGGSGNDTGLAVAVDSLGDRYLTGSSDSASLLGKTGTPGTYAFVIKLNPSGTAVIYSTFLGGTAAADTTTVSQAIAVDNTGCTDGNCTVYFTGNTNAPNLQSISTLQASYGGNQDAFLAKLNGSDGTVDYVSYLGGNELDTGEAVAVDASHNVYVGGSTLSSNFPGTTDNPLQPTHSPQTSSTLQGDGFLVKINDANGPPQFVYSTYFGGTGPDQVSGIALDTQGNAYLTGATGSSDLLSSAETHGLPSPPSDGASYQTCLNLCFDSGIATDAFVAELVSTASNGSDLRLAYFTYFGGSGNDRGTGIAVDGNGDVYLAGITSSSNLPTQNAFRPNYQGGPFDAFVAKLDIDAAPDAQLIYSTYLGGTGDDEAFGLAVDSQENAWMGGYTTSPNFPLEAPLQTELLGGSTVGDEPEPLGSSVVGANGFITEFSGDGTLLFSSYLGGNGDDRINGLAIDNTNTIHLIGTTSSTDFPSTSTAVQGALAGSSNAFVVDLNGSPAAGSLPDVQVVVSPNPGPVHIQTPFKYTITVSNNGPGTASGILVTDTATNASTDAASSSQGSCGIANNIATCVLGSLAAGQFVTVTVQVSPLSLGETVETAQVVREDQSDLNLSNNTSQVTTLVADNSGGGALSGAFLVCLACGWWLRIRFPGRRRLSLRETRGRTLGRSGALNQGVR